MSVSNTIFILLQPQLKDTNSVNNVAELLMKGGYIMIPIILLSLISIYIFIERFVYIRKNSVIDEKMVNAVINEIKNSRMEEA
jgi:biopolymer transport protein ExbB